MIAFLVLSFLSISSLAAGEYSAAAMQCAVANIPQQCLIGTSDNAASSCDEILAQNRFAKSGTYVFQDCSGTYTGYCEFGDLGECGKGPWNLVMKTDGTKNTFEYSSAQWTSKNAYNEGAAAEGVSGNSEMKLRSYWSVAVESICVGMSYNGKTNWLKIPMSGSSLYDLLSDGKQRSTNLNRDAWKSLIDGSSLQRQCNRQGLNAQTGWMKARFGIIGNQENNCGSPDSFLGIGISDTHHRAGITTGNYAGGWNPDNGVRRTKTIGIIMVKDTQSEAA